MRSPKCSAGSASPLLLCSYTVVATDGTCFNISTTAPPGGGAPCAVQPRDTSALLLLQYIKARVFAIQQQRRQQAAAQAVHPGRVIRQLWVPLVCCSKQYSRWHDMCCKHLTKADLQNTAGLLPLRHRVTAEARRISSGVGLLLTLLSP